MKPFWSWSWIVLCLYVAGCGLDKRRLVQEAPLISRTYTDQTGRQVNLPAAPERVVSLAPNITEIIFAIGAEGKLIARSQACDYPEAALRYPEVVTYPTLDLEQLKATGCDLIITTDEIFTPEDLAQLERLGIPIYLQSYHTLDDVYRGIRDMGQLMGASARANAVADSLQQLEKRITAETEKQIHYGTLLLVSAEPLKGVGGTGFLHELLLRAGGKNILEQLKEPYPNLTPEQILQAQPEVLLLPSSDTKVYGELIALYPALYNTQADLNKRVYIINPDLVYRPGPRMLQGLIEITTQLHSHLTPDQFTDAP